MEENETKKLLTQEQINKASLIANIYAMISWNGKTYDEAKEIVDETLKLSNNDRNYALEKLYQTTYAKDSINSALEGISDKQDILKNGKDENKFDAVIDILENIHNKWVEVNAKKIDRGTREKSEKMYFQHLPLELIGIEEVAKDAMFLDPFLQQVGIDIGEMGKSEYDSFKPSDNLKYAYQRKVEKFKNLYEIKTEENIKAKLPKIIEEYSLLHKTKDELNEIRTMMKEGFYFE